MPDFLRAAVTSRDGISVNERFHRAQDDLIFEVDLSAGSGADDGALRPVRFLERRARPGYSGKIQRDFDRLGVHLADCGLLVSLEFSRAAQKALAGKGFALHQARGEITAVLREILSQGPPMPGRGTAVDPERE